MRLMRSSIMRTDTSQRTYYLQSEPDHFRVGRLPNGNQVLMLIDVPDFVLVEFDADGNHLGITTRAMPPELLLLDRHGVWVGFDRFWVELEKLANDIGLSDNTITVRRFFIPDRELGIKDLPEFYEETLDGTNDFDEIELGGVMEEIQRWLDEGDFVFVWSQEYWMNREGEITST
jgi:hypothetical protein